MPGLFESLSRGAGQGATFNFGDELSAKLLAALPKPQDPEGTERNYAAGSPEADYLQKFRRDNAAAAEAHPLAFGTGAVVGSAPLAALVPGGMGGSAAARIASAGLTGGALGALGGAGAANGRPMLDQAARGAAMGGLLGAGGSALGEAAPAVISAFRNLPPPGGPQLAPAMAGSAAQLPAAVGKSMSRLPGNVSAAAQGGVREAISGTGLAPKEAQLTYSVDRPAMPPKSGAGEPMPEIPRAGRAPRESDVSRLEKIGEKADVLHGDKQLGRAPKDSDVEEYQSLLKDYKRSKPENDVQPATVRPPRKKAPAAGEPPRHPIQQELPFVDRNQRSSVDAANARRRFQDADELLRADPTHSSAIQKWIHESRSGAVPEVLDELQKKFSKNYGVGYRGMKTTPESLEKFLASGEIPQNEIASWSTNRDVAHAFADPGRVVLRQKSTSGIPVGRNEGEILTPKGRALQISGVSQDPEGFYNLDVE